MKLVYPAIFKKEDVGYSVAVPDLIGCCTQADTLEETIQMAEDAALGWLLTSLEENEKIPEASNINKLKLEKDEFASLLLLDLSAYSEKYSNRKSVKKTDKEINMNINSLDNNSNNTNSQKENKLIKNKMQIQGLTQNNENNEENEPDGKKLFLVLLLQMKSLE